MLKRHAFLFYLLSSGVGLSVLGAMEESKNSDPQDSQNTTRPQPPVSDLTSKDTKDKTHSSDLSLKEFVAQKTRDHTPPKFTSKLEKARWKAAQMKKKMDPSTLTSKPSGAKNTLISSEKKEVIPTFASKLEKARWKAQARKKDQKNHTSAQTSVSLYQKKLQDLGRHQTSKAPSILSTPDFQPYKGLFLYPLHKELHAVEKMALKTLKHTWSENLKTLTSAQQKSLNNSQDIPSENQALIKRMKEEIFRIETLLKDHNNHAPQHPKIDESASLLKDFQAIEKEMKLKDMLADIPKNFHAHMTGQNPNQSHSLDAHIKHIYAFTRRFDSLPYLAQCATWVNHYTQYKTSHTVSDGQHGISSSPQSSKKSPTQKVQPNQEEKFPSQQDIIQDTLSTIPQIQVPKKESQKETTSPLKEDPKIKPAKKSFKRSNQVTLNLSETPLNQPVEVDLSKHIQSPPSQGEYEDDSDDFDSIED